MLINTIKLIIVKTCPKTCASLLTARHRFYKKPPKRLIIPRLSSLCIKMRVGGGQAKMETTAAIFSIVTR